MDNKKILNYKNFYNSDHLDFIVFSKQNREFVF